jgi:hypothetical protein
MGHLTGDPARKHTSWRSGVPPRPRGGRPENAAESFRCGVRQSIEQAIAEGLGGEASVERLVEQIC